MRKKENEHITHCSESSEEHVRTKLVYPEYWVFSLSMCTSNPFRTFPVFLFNYYYYDNNNNMIKNSNKFENCFFGKFKFVN